MPRTPARSPSSSTTTSGSPIVMNGDTGSVGIPAVMISNADGQRLVDRLAADADDDDIETDEQRVTVRLARGIFASVPGDGNVVADFSSRGPSSERRQLLEARRHRARRRHPRRPDARRRERVARRDVPVLVRHVASGARGHGRRGAAQGSASRLVAERAEVGADDDGLRRGGQRTDGEAADAFDMGAGHIDPNSAVDPGLVYDSSFADHAAYLCGLPQPPFAAADCAAHAAAGFHERRPST